MIDAEALRAAPPAGLQRRWPLIAAALFALAWIAAAWRPRYPADWALENVLSLLSCWWLVRRHQRSPLSPLAYLLLLVFGVAHEVGSHYTYAEVPYDDWLRALTGATLGDTLGWQRNHYDRLVHFSFGLLCYRPLREVLVGRQRGRIATVFPVTVVGTISLLYELVEWAAAEVFGGDLGQAYLGLQGDEWDSQKDSGLALLGALTAMTLSLLCERLATRRRA